MGFLLSRVAAMTATALVVVPLLLASGGRAQVAPQEVRKKEAKPPLDARVEQQLKKAEIKYKVTPLNNFSILVGTEDPRDQEVFITSETEKYRDLEVREVWSKAMTTKAEVPTDIALRLLSDNSKMGGWRIEKLEEGGFLIYFAAHIPADCTPKMLEDVILFVGNVADKMEKTLTNKDDF